MKKKMTPRTKFIFQSLIGNHDLHDGVYYVKHLCDCKTIKGDTILWIGANFKESEVVIFVTNDDDTNQRFDTLACVDDSTLNKIIYQINPLVRLIVYRSMKKKNREDLPCNFCTESISPFMVETDEKGVTLCGEVGISGSTDEPYMVDVSVFYPNKIDATHSYDTPLYLMENEELRSILRKLSEENNLFLKRELEVEQSTTFELPITFTEVLKANGVDKSRSINYNHSIKAITTFFKAHEVELTKMGIEVSVDSIRDCFHGHAESILTKGVTDADVKRFYEE